MPRRESQTFLTIRCTRCGGNRIRNVSHDSASRTFSTPSNRTPPCAPQTLPTHNPDPSATRAFPRRASTTFLPCCGSRIENRSSLGNQNPRPFPTGNPESRVFSFLRCGNLPGYRHSVAVAAPRQMWGAVIDGGLHRAISGTGRSKPFGLVLHVREEQVVRCES